MRLLIKSVTILWENSDFHQLNQDVFLEDGIIRQIGTHLDIPDVEVWHEEGSYLSAGWFDLDANFGEPGFENREDLETGSQAALSGGFTGLALMPNTQPAFHAKTQIEFIKNKARELPIDLFPIGCISKNREGREMAELFDMYQTGALAFSDGDRPLENSGLLLRALQYTRPFHAKIFSYPEEISLSGSAKVHEGINSLRLGMKGIPSLSEEWMIQRDLMIAVYAESPIHFTSVSSSGAVELIREAKAKGQKVTASVPSYHLVLDDGNLSDFDTNYKVRPPLRSERDKNALIHGLKDGTIDAITSRHTPHEIEYKAVEFELALDGIVNLQTCFPLAIQGLGLESLNTLIRALTIKPRAIMGLSQPELKIGESANFCWFHPDKNWIFDKKSLKGKSFNSPFLNKEMRGKVLGVVFKNRNTQF